jgi:tRNA (guanine37-N1)-methyltransferase
MNFTVITLFPAIIDAYFTESIPAKAVEKGLIGYKTVQIREFAQDKHKTCDDAPYGGGAGMLLLPAPLSRALEAAGARPKEASGEAARPRVVYLSPSGRPFDQEKALEFSRLPELLLICGRYEGIDARIIERYVDEEISVGDYVLSSGELAALVVIDAAHRLVEGVITRESLTEESFSGGLLEYPQWTRPEEFDRLRVPEALLSGHHERIRRWRLERRVERTMRNRPDLLEKGVREGVFDQETLELIEKAAQGAGKEQ